MPDSFVTLIRNYYRDIDRGDMQRVLDLFAPEATYQRSASLYFDSKDAIVAFYTETRKLKGSHAVREICGDGNDVRVVGSFRGTNDGKPVEIQWRDRWIFNDDGKVKRRESELDQEGV